MDKVLFSAFDYDVTWTHFVLLLFFLFLAWMIWMSARGRPKMLDYKVESDLVCHVLNKALKNCGNSLDELPKYVEEHCQERYTIVEGTLYYQWHDGKRLQSNGPLDLDAFSSIAKVAEILARGKAWMKFGGKQGMFSAHARKAQVLRYLGLLTQ